MSIKGTKTEQNLLKAFAGESQARNRYTMFAQKAKEEGFVQVERIFLETADQERVHAQKFFSFLEGGPLEIHATYPAGSVGSTKENLKASADGEHEEWHDLYPEFAKIAEEEGFKNIAVAFKNISRAEAHHEERYRKMFNRMEENRVFESDSDTLWECINCGFLAPGKKAPGKCPACGVSQEYFQIKREAWI